MSAITKVTGRGLPVRGNDLDTDRIMPARFLRAVTFEGLERHVFEDDRAADPAHPFNDARYAGASILVVNSNFGCGSSREHAPQGLARFGITAIVGESFSEIFLGNAAVLGMPCFAADHASVEALQTAIERTPALTIEANVDSGIVTAGDLRIAASVPAALRDAFVSGQWNPTAMLLDRFEDGASGIRETSIHRGVLVSCSSRFSVRRFSSRSGGSSAFDVRRSARAAVAAVAACLALFQPAGSSSEPAETPPVAAGRGRHSLVRAAGRSAGHARRPRPASRHAGARAPRHGHADRFSGALVRPSSSSIRAISISKRWPTAAAPASSTRSATPIPSRDGRSR